MLRLNMITDIVERKKPTAEKSNTEMNYTTRNGLTCCTELFSMV